MGNYIFRGFLRCGEPVLQLFNEVGYRICLQTEPGWAPAAEAFHVMPNWHSHHRCIIDVGVEIK